MKKLLEDTIGHPEIPAGNSSLRIQNGPRMFQLEYKVEPAGTFFLFTSISDRATALLATDALRKNFRIMSRAAVLGSSMAPAEQEIIRFREETVADLASEVSRLGAFLIEMGKKNAEAVRTITTELEAGFQKRRQELDGKASEQQAILDRERSDFEKQRAAFNDRQRTHVRRDLLEKIQTNINARKDAPAVTESASRSRLYIHAVSTIVILASAAGVLSAGKHLYEATGKPPFDWRLVPPFSLAALVFGATLVFYFRWISRWGDRLAHGDLAAIQYASDILRASWIAELLFEYKDEKGKEIPAEVLVSLTEGLFKQESFRAVAYHPSDDLSSVLKRMKKIKAGSDGLEISVKRRSSRN